MSRDLFFENRKYILIKDAAFLTSYSKDYICQLCRQNKIDCRRIGKAWCVSEESILSYKKTPSQYDFSNNFKNQKKENTESVKKVVSPYTSFIRKSLGAFDFNTSQKLLPLALALIWTIGLSSLISNDNSQLAELATLPYTVSGPVRAALSKVDAVHLANDLSSEISTRPENLYRSLSDITDLYSDYLAEKYVACGDLLYSQSSSLSNVLFKNTVAFTHKPVLHTFASITSMRETADLRNNIEHEFTSISKSLKIPSLHIHNQASTAILASSNMSDVSVSFDQTGVVVYTKINNFFDTSIYTPLASLFENKKAAYVSPIPRLTKKIGQVHLQPVRRLPRVSQHIGEFTGADPYGSFVETVDMYARSMQKTVATLSYPPSFSTRPISPAAPFSIPVFLSDFSSDFSSVFFSALSSASSFGDSFTTLSHNIDDSRASVAAVVTSLETPSISGIVHRTSSVVYGKVNNFVEASIYKPLTSLFGNQKSATLVIIPRSAPAKKVATNIITAPSPAPIAQNSQLVSPPPALVLRGAPEKLPPATAAPTREATLPAQKFTPQSLSSLVTQGDLETRLQQFNNAITSKLSILSSGFGGSITNVYQQMATSQRIDQLTGTAITTPTISGGTISGTSITGGSISGTSITGTTLSGNSLVLSSALTVSNGGTGQQTFQSNALLIGNGTGAISTTSAGTDGQILALIGGVPTWQATSSITSASGVTNIASGGTNSTSFSPNSIITSNAAGTALIATSSQLTVGNLIASSTTATSTFAGGFAVGTTKFVVDRSTGFVGIGTTSPSQLLTVGNNNQFTVSSAGAVTAGTLLFSGNLTSVNGYLINSGNAASLLHSISLFRGSQNSYGLSTPDLYGQSNLVLGGNSTGGGNVLIAGNVGIGSTTPWAQLSVNPNALGSGVPEFVIGSSTATHLVVTGGGNVGIGTTTPAGKLQVSGGQILVDDGTASAPSFSFTSAPNWGIYRNVAGDGVSFSKAGTAVANFQLNGITAAGFGIVGSTNAQVGGLAMTTGGVVWGPNTTMDTGLYRGGVGKVYVGNGTQGDFTGTLIAGNVGIGTTTPWGQLSVNPNALGSGVPEFVIGSSTATHFVVTGGGNVGVGTTSPTTTLDVSGSVQIYNQTPTTGSTNITVKAGAGQSGDLQTWYGLPWATYRAGVTNQAQFYADSFRPNGNYFLLGGDFFANNALTIKWGPSSIYNTGSNDIGISRYAAGVIAIGNGTQGTTNGTLLAGSIGIGTTTPFAKLSIHANNGETNTTLFNISSSTASATTSLVTVLNNGNVGIGNTSPNTPLTIGANVAGVSGYSMSAVGTGNGGNILLQNTGGNGYEGVNMYDNSGTLSASFQYGNAGAGSLANTFFFGNRQSGATQIVSGGGVTPLATFLSNGNVGIGTTSPVSPLQVVGDLAFGNYAGPAGTWTAKWGSVPGFLNRSQISFNDPANPGLSFYYGNDVASDGTRIYWNTVNANIIDISPGSRKAYFGDGTKIYIQGTGANFANKMVLSYEAGYGQLTTTAGSLNLTSATGNVGIGTTTPGANLTIQALSGTANALAIASSTGAITASINNQGEFTSGINGTSNGKLTFNSASGGAYSTQLAQNGTGFAITTSNSDLSLVAGAGRSFWTVWGGGWSTGLGISASSPMTYSDPVFVSMGVTFNNSGLAKGLSITPTYNQTGTASSADLFINRTETVIGTGVQNLIQAQTSNIDKFTVSRTGQGYFAGNVGIGTTTPWAQLSVNPNALGSGVPEFVVGSSTATHFVITGGGNVGIGTSTPGAMLDIYGNTTVSNGVFTILPTGSNTVPSFQFGNPAVEKKGFSAFSNEFDWIVKGNTRILIYYPGTTDNRFSMAGDMSLAWTGTSVGNGAQDTGLSRLAPGKIGVGNGTQGDYTGTLIAGNVGIGTTTPWGQLSVNPNALGSGVPEFVVGSSTATHFVVTGGGNVGIGTTNPSTLLNVYGGNIRVDNQSKIAQLGINSSDYGTNGAYPGLWLGQTSPSITNYTMLYDSNNGGTIFNSPTGADNISFRVANVTKMFIQASNGNVGIGTTTPTSTLSVQGTGAVNPFSVTSSTGTSLLTVLANGNVGIGVTNPLARLHLSGGDPNNQFNGAAIALGFASSGQYPSFIHTRHNANTGTGNAIDFYTGDGTATGVFPTNAVLGLSILNGSVGIGTTTPTSTLFVQGTGAVNPFNIASSTGASLMTVLANGNVGVGTTTPSAMLYVAGNATNSTATFFNPTTNTQVVIQTPIPTDGGVANSPFVIKNRVGTIVAAIREDGVNYAQTFSTIDNATAAINNPGAIGLGLNLAGFDLSNTGSIGWSNSTAYYNQVDTVLSRISAGVVGVGKTAQGQTSGTFLAANVGIGTTTPWRTLSVTGTVGFDGLTSATTGNYLCIDTTTKQITSGTTCTLSSERFKTNILSLPAPSTLANASSTMPSSALAEVLALRPVSFNFKQGFGDNGSTTQLGFIAEEAMNVDPRLVPLDKDGLPGGFFYQNYTAVLTKAIQEMNLNIESIAGATTTASITPASESFASHFFQNIFAKVTTWLADAGNGIGKLFAKEVHTDQLCVGETCVTQEQFLKMVNQSNQTASANNSSGGSSTGSGTASSIPPTATPTPAPATIGTSTPEATPPAPAPAPDPAPAPAPTPENPVVTASPTPATP